MNAEGDRTPSRDRMIQLLSAEADGWLEAEERQELLALLRRDPRARAAYAEQAILHSLLFHKARCGQRRGTAGLPAIEHSVAAAVELPRQLDLEPQIPNPPFPSLSTTHYPLPTNFVGGPVFSYMVATVILGMMLLGAWAYKITHYNQIADAPSATSNARPELVFVGRITGMADCRWADPQTEAYAGASVPLGRKYALASGLMEITYTTGAKVILQGPCTYEVESRRGGYLALGKLTARIEEGEERREERAKPQAANLQISKSPNLQISNPQSLIPNPLFSVRTPTAVVTDLGTEFGVEVEQDGNTISHVFRGSVRVQVVASERGTGPIGAKHPPGRSGQLDLSPFPTQGVVLRENESARVEKGAGKPSIARRAAAEDSGFVLKMPPPKSVRDSEAYAELVLSFRPVVYYRMERPKKGTGPIGAKHPAGRSGQLDLSPFSRVFDSAPGGHHGELRLGNEFGSPYVPGRFGDALWLRGPAVNDRVIVPDYPKATDDQLTVSAWVLATGRPGWATIVGNFGKFDVKHNQVGQFYLGLHRHDGDIFACVTQQNGRRGRIREGASQPLPLYVWQHVALAADGTSLHLYRNGEEVATSPSPDGLLLKPPVVVGLGIGCRLTNETGTDAAMDEPGYNFWQGRIDEVSVFNQALSPETIQALYLGKQLSDQTEATKKTMKGEQPMNGP